MRNMFSLKNSFDAIAVLITAGAILGVVQTFAIGKHYIIPTMVLIVAVLFGNLARYGLMGQRWAKEILFWLGIVLTGHFFFALFWSRRYREWLGDSFECFCVPRGWRVAFLVVHYARKNELFK